MKESVFLRLLMSFGLFLFFNPVYAQNKDLYPNFPEKFKTLLVKDQYTSAIVPLESGNWRLAGAKLMEKKRGIDIKDDGTKALVFISKNKSDVFAEMQFDLPYGASMFKIDYSSYGSDLTSQWQLEMSVDGQGKKWETVGDVILADNKLTETAEFLLNTETPVRFRILKLGLGGKDDLTLHNGRLVVDNIRIYMNK